jgi:hypothetical protein
LREPPNRYLHLGVGGITHGGGDHTARHLSSMGVTPRYTPRTDVGAELDEALSSEMIEIEL